MSIAAMSYVWENSKQEGGSLLVLLALADYSNDRGEAYPSIKTLGKKARLGERQTQRVIQHLEENGEITVLKNHGPSGVNVYRINRGDKMSGETRKTGGGDIQDVKGESPMSPKPSLNRQEPSGAQSALPLAIEEKTKRFTPPSKQEVEEYFKTIGMNGSSGIEAEKFVNYYDARGWMMGKAKMKKWKAAANGWKLRNEERSNAPAPGTGTPAKEEWRKHWPTWCRQQGRGPTEYQFAPEHDKSAFWAWLKQQPFYKPSAKKAA